MSHEIQTVQTTPKTADSLFQFYDPAALHKAMADVGYNVEEEVRLVMDAIRQSGNVWAVLAGVKYLSSRTKDALLMSGQLRQLEGHFESVTPDGTYKVEAKQLQLLTNANTHAEIIQEMEDTNDDAIDVESEEIQIDPDEDSNPTHENGGVSSGSVEGDDSDTWEGIGEVREGHFPPRANAGGLAGRKANREGPESTE